MTNVDVQLMALGAIISMGDAGIKMDHPTFDDLAAKVAEAALNKKGRETVAITPEDIKQGDYLFGIEITGVVIVAGSPYVELHLGIKSESMMVRSDRFLKIERPIQ